MSFVEGPELRTVRRVSLGRRPSSCPPTDDEESKMWISASPESRQPRRFDFYSTCCMHLDVLALCLLSWGVASFGGP